MALELGRRGAKVIVNYANSDSAAEEVVQLIKKNGRSHRRRACSPHLGKLHVIEVSGLQPSV